MGKNVLLFTVFLIGIIGITSFFALCYNNCNSFSKNSQFVSNFDIQNQSTFTQPSPNQFSSTKFIFISDSHDNNLIFDKLSIRIKSIDSELLVHLGDLTNFGDIDSLNRARGDLNKLNIKYIAIPGDHDVAQTFDDSNFNKFFSYPTIFEAENVKLLFIPNFYNFTEIPSPIFENVKSQIGTSDILVLAQPLFVPKDNIFSNKYMGSETAFENISKQNIEKLKKVKIQRDEILNIIRNSTTPKLVISGDHHRSSTFVDPINKNITYHIVGSLSEFIYFGNSRLKQSALQSNRFSVIEVIESNPKSFKIEEIEIN